MESTGLSQLFFPVPPFPLPQMHLISDWLPLADRRFDPPSGRGFCTYNLSSVPVVVMMMMIISLWNQTTARMIKSKKTVEMEHLKQFEAWAFWLSGVCTQADLIIWKLDQQ